MRHQQRILAFQSTESEDRSAVVSQLVVFIVHRAVDVSLVTQELYGIPDLRGMGFNFVNIMCGSDFDGISVVNIFI